jgi:benzil reductase ((S)-benzoin forming)
MDNIYSMESIIWISGASSGIGAALAASVPDGHGRVVGIARRPPPAGEHLAADLSDRAGWATVQESFAQVLGSGQVTRATFMHFAGEGRPHGPAAQADRDLYTSSVLLNAASGLVLGQAFLSLCRTHGVAATLVVCSSPGALEMHRGMAHYGAAKAALLHWTGTVRQEEPDSVILAVIPWAVDTPMLRDAAAQPAQANPMSGRLREDLARGEFATAEQAAAEIWQAVSAGAARSPLHVGRVPDLEGAAAAEVAPS